MYFTEWDNLQASKMTVFWENNSLFALIQKYKQLLTKAGRDINFISRKQKLIIYYEKKLYRRMYTFTNKMFTILDFLHEKAHIVMCLSNHVKSWLDRPVQKSLRDTN